MTANTDNLSWLNAKNALVLSIGGLLVAFLGFLLAGQTQANATLAEVRKDIAVIAAETKRDREEFAELKERVRALEIVRKGER